MTFKYRVERKKHRGRKWELFCETPVPAHGWNKMRDALLDISYDSARICEESGVIDGEWLVLFTLKRG